jgi:HSP20 family protein
MTTSMIRWTSEADLFRTRFDRLFQQMFQDFFNPVLTSEDVSARRWVPPVDIQETDEALIFSAELPGLKKEDVQITLENNVLTISGERNLEKEVKSENFHRLERSYGQFSRSFTLPANVQTEKAEAKFADGVLTITLPKAEESKPRKLEIR